METRCAENRIEAERVDGFSFSIPQVRDALVVAGVAGLGLAALGIIGTVMKKKKQQNQ